jgi:hypothetical protein
MLTFVMKRGFAETTTTNKDVYAKLSHLFSYKRQNRQMTSLLSRTFSKIFFSIDCPFYYFVHHIAFFFKSNLQCLNFRGNSD